MAKKITTKINGLTVVLDNCREIKGHDDSLPYEADVYINGEHCASLFNDGWGGTTTINKVSTSETTKLFNDLEDEFGKIKEDFMEIDFLFDMMVYYALTSYQARVLAVEKILNM